MEKRGRRIRRKRITLFFRVMRSPYRRFSHHRALPGKPCRIKRRPPTASPAERVAVGSEEIPCPAKKPRRKAGDSCQTGATECRKQGEIGRGPSGRPAGGPQPRAQRSGSRLEAKKFPVRLRSLAVRRGIHAKQGQQSVGNKGKWEGARLAALWAAPNREPSEAGRGWKRRNSLSG